MARLPFTHGQARNQSEGNNRAIAVVRYSNKSHHFDHPKISSGCGPAHGCQVSPSSSTLRFHIPLFRCLMIAKYIIYLRMADGEDCVKFCEGICLLDNGFTILLIFFGHFMSVTAQIMPLYKNLGCLVSNVLGNKDYHGKALMRTHLWRRGLALSPLHQLTCNIHGNEKEGCVLRKRFLSEQRWTKFWSHLPRNTPGFLGLKKIFSD